MALRSHASLGSNGGKVVAVLGPTNTGKTHLAIERLCAHSSGAIGFPLRLLAREVYDRVVAIKGEAQVALITGEERIEPPGARWFLCTMEAMPRRPDLSFIALDEVQLCADPERGHIFTDRLLNTRGRDETMILGSAVIEPLVRALVPEAEIVSRPRFSTLSHVGAKKLSRVPPRSAIVAFSAEQVYAVAEMLRRFRGGAAVVMGALSPQTRNAQVALYQSGEVDYLVATDAIGMGLNLDIAHVAFAGLSKFDGKRQRRLNTMEMAQIAGRAGRHQRDGSFGTLAGTAHHDAEFTPEEIYAIEEHRFPPLTRLFWREAEPRHDSLDRLIDDLSQPPERTELAPAPEAIDLAVMRLLASDPAIAATVRGRAAVARFQEVCTLPDFRQQGAEVHSRFVARLWEDLRRGALPGDYVAARIAELDNPSGGIDMLQGRIAAVRSWSYITQRPDWVLAREEMAARARAAETKLSDALHARLTERFVNRRATILMRSAARDAALLPVIMKGEEILVDGEAIGKLEGFRFKVDPQAQHGDHKLLFAAAERHLPQLLGERAAALTAAIGAGEAGLELDGGAIRLGPEALAQLRPGKALLAPRIELDHALDAVPAAPRGELAEALSGWLAAQLAVLEPLAALDTASRELEGGPELRALLIRLVEGGGVIERRDSGLDSLIPAQRERLRKLGVRIGALDIFLPAMLRPAPQAAWHRLAAMRGSQLPAPSASMPSVIPHSGREAVPHGYRRVGRQSIRVDLAERLLRAAHERRVALGKPGFHIDEAVARSMALTAESHYQLLSMAGFIPRTRRALAEGEQGPPAPTSWRWRPIRHGERAAPEGTRDQRKGKDGGRNGKRDGGGRDGGGSKPRGGKPDKRPPGGNASAKPRDEPAPTGGAFAELAKLLR